MRKAKPKKRIILPDPKFGDVSVTKFVNHLMFDGKKNTSYRIFYTALDLVGQKMAKEEKTPLEIWKNALEKVTPQVEVKSRRIGGATFQVPTEIRADRKESISMKNLIIFARMRAKMIRFFIDIDSLRSARISVGTWKVAPPIRRDFTST